MQITAGSMTFHQTIPFFLTEEEGMAQAEEAQKIGNVTLKTYPSLQPIKLSSLWESSKVVLVFFRRFGCIFCRSSAKEISLLKPILDKNDVKLVGVGMEATGIEEFVREEYFAGEIYLDDKKETYKALGYKTYGYLGLVKTLFLPSTLRTGKKCATKNIKGNLIQGDGFQNGGVLILAKGGTEVLMSYKQENPADHPPNQDILTALGIYDAGELQIQDIDS